MDKTTALATQILAGVGGEGNILKLENCMTRVRVEVSDEQRLDLAALKQLPGVKGYIKQGEQHQFIVGPGAAAKVVDAMRGLLSGNAQPAAAVGDAARTKAQAKQKYAAPMSGALKKLADVFIPLIPAFIASGLITGIINLLKRPDIAGQLAVDYPNVLGLLAIFGSAVFAIMNILVGVNAARVFGGSQAMGGVMAGILSSPALAQITLFGEALQPGRGGVIAVLLVVALMCWVEKRLRTLLPESVELILNPLLTTLVTASLAILILQPVGGLFPMPSPTAPIWRSTRAGCWWGRCSRGCSCRWCSPACIRGWCRSTSSWCRRTVPTRCCRSWRWPASVRWGRRWRCC